ncbi:MAG TPA: sodium/solute symporter [Longimicrobiales bacterium]|nr:sodium/solute symporter [Longimicrobiales bacterium]
MTAPLWVFGCYFAALFALGAWALRRTRDESDYWIAGGRLGWLTGGATLAATHASAGTFIGTVGVIYTVGWSFAWLVLTIPVAYGFMAVFLAPRFTRVRELTLPAFLETRYGSRVVRTAAAIIILLATVVYIQAQVVAGGLVANTLFGIPTLWGMTGFTALLIVYTMVGGMVAVVYTDILQLAVMTLGAMAAVPMVLRHLGGLDGLLSWVRVADPGTFSWGALPGPLLFTMAVAFTLGSVSTPEKLVRLYAMRDMSTVRRGILLAVVLTTGMNLLVFLLALSARVLFPALPTGDLAMPLVATTVLPGVLGALMLAAVTAAMMSTVDSLLLVAGSALSHDLYGTWAGERASRRTRLWIDRLGIVVVGVVPLLLLASGVGEGELVQFIVLLFSALMAAAFFAPVVLGVYWARATRQGALAAMIGGAGATFLWEAFGSETVDPVLPGVVVSFVLLWGVSLATPAPAGDPLAPYRDRPDAA